MTMTVKAHVENAPRAPTSVATAADMAPAEEKNMAAVTDQLHKLDIHLKTGRPYERIMEKVKVVEATIFAATARKALAEVEAALPVETVVAKPDFLDSPTPTLVDDKTDHGNVVPGTKGKVVKNGDEKTDATSFAANTAPFMDYDDDADDVPLADWTLPPVIVIVGEAHYYVHCHIVARMFPKMTFSAGAIIPIDNCTSEIFNIALSFMYHDNVGELNLDTIDDDDKLDALTKFAVEHSNTILLKGLFQTGRLEVIDEQALRYIARIYQAGIPEARFRNYFKTQLETALNLEFEAGYITPPEISPVFSLVQRHLSNAGCAFEDVYEVLYGIASWWYRAVKFHK